MQLWSVIPNRNDYLKKHYVIITQEYVLLKEDVVKSFAPHCFWLDLHREGFNRDPFYGLVKISGDFGKDPVTGEECLVYNVDESIVQLAFYNPMPFSSTLETELLFENKLASNCAFRMVQTEYFITEITTLEYVDSLLDPE